MTAAPVVHHIIILEDEPALRDDLTEYLSKQGFTVSAAATLEEYRQIAVVVKPDLVLLDINLHNFTHEKIHQPKRKAVFL